MLHHGEVALERRKQRRLGAALDHLGEKRAAVFQHPAGELRCGLDQRHDLQMIGRTMTGGVGGHVGQHQVGRAAEHRLELVRRIGVEKVDLREFSAGNRIHRQDVDADDASARADALDRDLAPAAGRGAQIDHARAALQHVMLVIDLGQLERRARTKALALGARHIRIVELALEPQLGRQRLPLALDPDLELALAASASAFLGCHGTVALASPQTPS